MPSRKLTLLWVSVTAIQLVVVGPSLARINPESIVAIWLFDEGKGDEAADSSGNGYDGVFTGKPRWVEGKFGKALDLPGSGDTLMIAEMGGTFPTKEVTIMSWVNLSEVKNQDLFSMEPLETGDRGRVTVHMPWGATIHWQFGTPYTGFEYPFSEDWVGEWKHWAFLVSVGNNTMTMYEDGKRGDTLAMSQAFAPDEAAFHIGGRLGSSIAGIIDEFAVFSVALDAEEIAWIVDSGLERTALSVEPAGKLAATWGVLKGRE